MLDLAIIGGGPAGLTAGLYATRGGLKNVTMFEKGVPGGQITLSSEIENYPGVTGDISGIDLMDPWLNQCQKFGLKHERKEVIRIEKEKNHFLVFFDNGPIEKALTVLTCTGSTSKRAGFKNEDLFFGRGISTCATCDGFFYKEKQTAVIGGGDTAIEEALYLSKICSKVYLIHRRDTFRATPDMLEKAKNSKNIEFILNATPKEVYGDKMGVSGLKVATPKGIRDLKVLGVFVFVGRDINNEILKQKNKTFLCDMSDLGEVKVDLKMQTSLAGLYAAGDMREDAPKQVISAAGDGCVAGMAAINYVNHLMHD